MAEPLKNMYGREIPEKIGEMLAGAHRPFPRKKFVAEALDGYDQLELKARGMKIARAMRTHLPLDYAESIDIILRSMGPTLETSENPGMGPFLYMPHTLFVSEFGLDHFEESMRAQYELTQRFTAEFSIRAFLQRHQEKTLARLHKWSRDSSAHVRRLVSEGTRPRLPWASRLPEFQKDPKPVLELLELLKDDSSLYVRRSVANNLNDIGKDHPAVLAATAKRWLKGASEERTWVVRHALRSAIKRAEPGALEVLGVHREAKVRVLDVAITPARPHIGGKLEINFTLESIAREKQDALVDLRIHYVKTDGRTSPRVFKLKELTLGGGERVAFRKTISLQQMTTRTHYPGRHFVEVVVNGRGHEVGEFELRGGKG